MGSHRNDAPNIGFLHSFLSLRGSRSTILNLIRLPRYATISSPSLFFPVRLSANLSLRYAQDSPPTMTHWRDPTVLTSEDFILIKFIHVLGGVYIWEFLSNLGYEYSIITRERKFTRTFPLYLGCRWCPLFCVIFQFIGSDVVHKINCKAWVIATFTFGYLSLAFASSLIVLRVVALWDHNKIATTLATVTWLANTGMYIYSATTASAGWHGNICMALRTEHGGIGVISTLISDFVLLILMLFGLLRWKGTQEKCGLWWFLYTQVVSSSTWSSILTDAIHRAWRGWCWSLLLRFPLQCVCSATWVSETKVCL
ncbi:hypothetical protein F5888DRAFT_1684101 [Russula emetica]|nr:hypothetical protein F5888DRAFT_1684101 [Russula emetica]